MSHINAPNLWFEFSKKLFENSSLKMLISEEMNLVQYKKILVKLFYFHLALETSLRESDVFKQCPLLQKAHFLSEQIKHDLAKLGLSKDCYCESNILCYPIHQTIEEAYGALLMRDSLCDWHHFIQEKSLKRMGLKKDFGASLFFREKLNQDLLNWIEDQVELKKINLEQIYRNGFLYYQRLLDLFPGQS